MWNKMKQFFKTYWKPVAIVGGISVTIIIGLLFKIDARVLALWALIAGFVTNGFVALGTLVALVPILGPLLIKLLSLPIFYLFNGIGYLVSLLLIKKGYGAEVVSHRLLSIILLVGVAIGYILGNLLPL